MRNSRYPSIATLILVMFLNGCANDTAAKRDLDEGYVALESNQYDQAMARSDAVLQRTPVGTGTAEALYLRGRALEQKPARNAAEAQANLKSARAAYVDALTRSPSAKLAVYIRTSLANVAYFQEDYVTAATEWTGAYEKLDDKDVKSWTLYRVGICRQRMGQFADADKVFQMVQQQYPNTVPALRAKEHEGIRNFSIQFATFASAPAADNAVASLRREGVMATKQIDPKGRNVVVAGPMPSYQQAQTIKARFASTFRDALILP